MMNPQYTITFQGESKANREFLWSFWINGVGQQFAVNVYVRRETWEDWKHELKRGRPSPPDEQLVRNAILRLAVERLEQGLREGSVTESSNGGHAPMIEIPFEDHVLVRGLLDLKNCSYRVSQERDLYCGAVVELDERVGLSNDRGLGEPTSLPLCQTCDMPAAEVVCSDLTHPRVKHTATHSSIERSVERALCNGGNQSNLDDDVSKCKLGGHACASRRVFEIVTDTPPVDGPAFAESLDSLDDSWRLAFGKASRLVRVSRAGEIAGLMKPVADADGFRARLSDLADVMKNLDIPDQLLPPENRPGKDQPLQRLKAALESKAPDRTAEIRRAVETLQKVNAIRTGFQHSGDAATKRARAFAALGLAYPPASHAQLWAKILGLVHDALATLRGVVREIAATSV